MNLNSDDDSDEDDEHTSQTPTGQETWAERAHPELKLKAGEVHLNGERELQHTHEAAQRQVEAEGPASTFCVKDMPVCTVPSPRPVQERSPSEFTVATMMAAMADAQKLTKDVLSSGHAQGQQMWPSPREQLGNQRVAFYQEMPQPNAATSSAQLPPSVAPASGGMLSAISEPVVEALEVLEGVEVLEGIEVLEGVTVLTRSYKQPWTAEDDRSLLQLVNTSGAHSWNKIASSLPSRSPKQCQRRCYLRTT